MINSLIFNWLMALKNCKYIGSKELIIWGFFSALIILCMQKYVFFLNLMYQKSLKWVTSRRTYWSSMMSLQEEAMMYPAEEAMTAWIDDTNLKFKNIWNEKNLSSHLLLQVLLLQDIRDSTKHGFGRSNLADTMTASPSLHLSAGMDFKHCLDRRKRPGKNTDPAAKMISMVPCNLSDRQKVQQAIWSMRSVALRPLWNKKQNKHIEVEGMKTGNELTTDNSLVFCFSCTFWDNDIWALSPLNTWHDSRFSAKGHGEKNIYLKTQWKSYF